MTTATGTAIYCHGVLGLTARNNDFQNCFIGINATSWVGTSFEILIEGNRFTIDSSAAGTPISADIIADTAGTSNIIVNNNLFAHLLPAGGVNLYGTIANARHGLVCNNIFGHSATLTVGAGGTAFVCPANVGSANNYCHGALMLYQ